MAAYASDRASSHRSISDERSQPIAREFGPPSRTAAGKPPVRTRRHNEVRDRPVNSSTARVRKITG